MAFILLPECLITIREGDLADFRLLRMRARRGQVACHSPSDLLFTILEQKVEKRIFWKTSIAAWRPSVRWCWKKTMRIWSRR